MTGDDHGNGGPRGASTSTRRSARAAARSPTGSACAAPPTSTRTPPRSPTPRPPRSRPQGFEIGAARHHQLRQLDLDGRSSSRFYSSQLADWSANYPSLAPPVTNRTHCIAWSDWATQPKVELENGIRLDTNYYYWPPAWIQDRPGMFTGSGMPMRFADLDGSMIDVYQAATQMTDESGQTEPVQRSTRCSTRRSGPRATTASSPPTCTPTTPRIRAPMRSSPRRCRAECRSSPHARCSSGSTAATGPRSTR